MFSDEYAMHQKISVGIAPISAAKTRALFKEELEDEVVKGKYILLFSINKT